jgi:hypothetical protein
VFTHRVLHASRDLCPFQTSESLVSQALQQLDRIPNGAAGIHLLGQIAQATGRRADAILLFQAALTVDPYMWCSFEQLCALGVDAAPEAWIANVSVPLPEVASVVGGADAATPFILQHGVVNDTPTAGSTPSPFTPAVRMQVLTTPPGPAAPRVPQPLELLSPATPKHTLTPISHVKPPAVPLAPHRARIDASFAQQAPAPKTLPLVTALPSPIPFAPPPLPTHHKARAAEATGPPPSATTAEHSNETGNMHVLTLLGLCGIVQQHVSMYVH